MRRPSGGEGTVSDSQFLAGTSTWLTFPTWEKRWEKLKENAENGLQFIECNFHHSIFILTSVWSRKHFSWFYLLLVANEFFRCWVAGLTTVNIIRLMTE